MNTYIKSFESINESMKQHGIILIKGKPKGKNKEQMLFATHVNNWTEFRPGSMMLFLSDTFYRITKEGTRLKGVKIDWRDEESLKAVLNFKAPGKLSVVRNNNKTPYHWKTLNHTNLRDALDSIDEDLIKSSFLFESVDSIASVEEIVTNDVIDAIFKDGTNVIILDWDIPTNSLTDEINSTSYTGSETTEWEATFDCIHIGRPELDDVLKEMELNRFEVTITFESTFSFHRSYDPGDRDTPPDEDIEITDIDTEISYIAIGEIELDDAGDLNKIVSDMEGYDLETFIKKKHEKFI